MCLRRPLCGHNRGLNGKSGALSSRVYQCRADFAIAIKELTACLVQLPAAPAARNDKALAAALTDATLIAIQQCDGSVILSAFSSVTFAEASISKHAAAVRFRMSGSTLCEDSLGHTAHTPHTIWRDVMCVHARACSLVVDGISFICRRTRFPVPPCPAIMAVKVSTQSVNHSFEPYM